MKRWILLTALLLVLCTACAAAESTTLMMYMCGTDLQSSCVADLQEMCRAQAGSDVRIVVLAGGTRRWDDHRLKGGRLNLFTIENGTLSTVTDWGRASMGSADTLSRFLEYAWQLRSERNLLVLWDHGGGAAQGLCFDELYDDDGLTLTELDEALAEAARKNSGFHLDMLGCDACLMADYELAVAASAYADYFVASQELVPDLGWAYADWLRALAADPAMDTALLCRSAVETYAAECRRDGSDDHITMSVIDLRRIGALRTDMEQLALYLQDALAHGQLATISRSVNRMYAMGSYDSRDSSNDMYDLAELLTLSRQFAPDTAASAMEHLQEAVICNYATADMPSACGMSIYIPQRSRRTYARDTLPGYSIAGSIPSYVDFVSALAGQMNGSGYTFTASGTVSQPAGVIDSQSFLFGTYIPCGTYNAETGTATSFAAGSGTAAATQSSSAASSSGGLFSNLPQTTSSGLFNALPQTTIGGVPSFAAGSSMQPQAPQSSDLAFSLSLQPEDLEYLSYAEGALFMDLSDEDGLYLLELGYLRNSWIDWSDAAVYSTFDGSWPTLDGQLVVLYDRSSTELSRRSLIPVTVNGEETCLVVSFDAGSNTGRILGHNAGVNESGLLIRRTEPLKPGDVIIPQYTLYACSWDEIDTDDDMEELLVEGDPIIWRDDLQVVYEPLDDPDDPTDYQFAFYLNDIFGDYQTSDYIPFAL